jgi:hypothetical protein
MFSRLFRLVRGRELPANQKQSAALKMLMDVELGQDMDLFGETTPAAIADFARNSQQSDRGQLLRDMDEFTQRFHDCLEEAFDRWFGGRNPRQFFDMVRAIIADPECYVRFEQDDR